jgi:hypothetical protein
MFLWGTVVLNTKFRKTLNGGNLSLIIGMGLYKLNFKSGNIKPEHYSVIANISMYCSLTIYLVTWCDWRCVIGIQLRFQVLMVESLKMAVFWVVVSCNLVEVYWCFRGSKHIWNVCKLVPDYMAQQSRRQPCSGIQLFFLNSYFLDSFIFRVQQIVMTVIAVVLL